MRRIIGILLILVLTVIAPAAKQVRDGLWQSYQGYLSPYLTPVPRGQARLPMAPRVVVVLVRALRLAESRQMPTLNNLRERGADVTLEVPPPTYHLPAAFGLLSGARPEVHGITANTRMHQRPDTVIDALQTITRSITIVGEDNWADWFEGAAASSVTSAAPAPTGLHIEQPDAPDAATRDGQAIELALTAMRDPNQPASFVLIELQLLETVAMTDPASYTTAAAATDFRIKTLVDALDFNTSALVIVSDRGLTNVFHDGGGEADVAHVPLVMTGAGIAPHTQAIAPQTSLAPTLSALAGAPAPMQAESGPVFDVLAASPQLPLISAQSITTFYEQWSEVMRQPRFASELLRRYQDALAGGDTVAYLKWQTELDAQVSATIAARLAAERASRLPFVIGAILMLVLLTGLFLNDRPFQPLGGLAAYTVLWLALFFLVRGDHLTLSLFPSADPTDALGELARNSAALMAAVSIIVTLFTVRHEDALDALTTVLCTLGLIALLNAAVFAWFYWQWGDAWSWTLPDSTALVLAMTSLTQLGAFLVPLVPALPDLPLTLPITVLSALVFGLLRGRPRRGES